MCKLPLHSPVGIPKLTVVANTTTFVSFLMMVPAALRDDFEEFQISLCQTNPALNDPIQIVTTKSMAFSLRLPVPGAKYEIKVRMKTCGQYGNPAKFNV